jgi:hypothetical protein
MWRAGRTIVALKTQQSILYVFFEVHVTVNSMTILSVAQKYSYDEFMARAAMKSTGSSCKASYIFVQLQRNLEFLGRISRKSLISNFTEIRPVGASLARADRHQDMYVTNEIDASRDFGNAPRNW